MSKSRSKTRRKRRRPSTKTDGDETSEALLILLALGANLPSALGGPETTLYWAVSQLAARLTRPRVAALFESAPLDATAQPNYLNTVLAGRTHETPERWLEYGKSLEREAGRRPGPRWGARPLDVDILAFGAEKRSESHLTLPHPDLARRRFVLAPLAELLPDLRLPGFSQTVADLLDLAPPEPAVSRRSWRDPPLSQTGSG